MLVCNLRKISFEKDIRSISELERITKVSRPTLQKMYDNVSLETIKIESLLKVCKGLKIGLFELIEYNENSGV